MDDGYRNDNEFVIFGIKRTGNHAIVNWIAGHFKEPIYFYNNLLPFHHPFQRDYNRRGYKCLEITQPDRCQYTKKNCIIYSYEDFNIELLKDREIVSDRDNIIGKSRNYRQILILRDPFNLFASRYLNSKNDKKMSFKQELLDLWITYAKEYLNKTSYLKNKVCVNFNEWFSDKPYRVRLSSRLGLKHTDEGLNYMMETGHGSSFSELRYRQNAQKLKVNDRWERFVSDKVYKEYFKKYRRFGEMLDLSGKIFLEVTRKVKNRRGI